VDATSATIHTIWYDVTSAEEPTGDRRCGLNTPNRMMLCAKAYLKELPRYGHRDRVSRYCLMVCMKRIHSGRLCTSGMTTTVYTGRELHVTMPASAHSPEPRKQMVYDRSASTLTMLVSTSAT
jgi:hypothetical protein